MGKKKVRLTLGDKTPARVERGVPESLFDRGGKGGTTVRETNKKG